MVMRATTFAYYFVPGISSAVAGTYQHRMQPVEENGWAISVFAASVIRVSPRTSRAAPSRSIA